MTDTESRTTDPGLTFESSESANKFYSNAKKYWENVPSTVDGMLGGLGYFSDMDIRESKLFLKKISSSSKLCGNTKALDCGAGIGRVTKFLLIPSGFCKIDMVEQDANFLEQSKEYLKKFSGKIDNRFRVGLQDFDPKESEYDVIWCQWVLGHLTDSDFIQFFTKCRTALKPKGLIFVKENVTSSNNVEIDEVDSSMTRPMEKLELLLAKADLKIIAKTKQKNYPPGLYPIYMWALKPNQPKCNKINSHLETKPKPNDTKSVEKETNSNQTQTTFVEGGRYNDLETELKQLHIHENNAENSHDSKEKLY